jgi:predicted O-methyltransferase YrrM
VDALTALVAEATVNERGYRAWDDMGVEAEVAEYLYGLVRMLKPELVVESGTGSGYAAFALATALQANGHGRLVTYEPLGSYQQIAAARLAGLPAEVLPGYACDVCHLEPDLLFIDSWGGERQRDLDHWLPKQHRVLVHDAHDYQLPADGFLFDTPRGLWVRL